MATTKSRGVSTILILGVIAILVTIIVPLLSRTVVDVRITKQQEEQARAFSAAESGLERALISSDQTQGQIGSNINYQVSSLGTTISEQFIYPKAVEKNFPVTVWMIEHQGTNFDADAPLDLVGSRCRAPGLNLYWGDPGIASDSNLVPAIEGTLFYQDTSGNYRIQKYLYDPNISRRSQNNFSAPTGEAGYTLTDTENHDHQFHFIANINNLPCTGQQICYAMRLRLLYNDDRSHPLALVTTPPGHPLTRQGECLESVATVQTSGISSRIQRCVFYRDFPAIFDFVLYSNSTLEKTIP